MANVNGGNGVNGERRGRGAKHSMAKKGGGRKRGDGGTNTLATRLTPNDTKSTPDRPARADNPSPISPDRFEFTADFFAGAMASPTREKLDPDEAREISFSRQIPGGSSCDPLSRALLASFGTTAAPTALFSCTSKVDALCGEADRVQGV
jgi:hypothetical protein